MKTHLQLLLDRAFSQDPLVLPKALCELIVRYDSFLSMKFYARDYRGQMISGEIGIFNGRRIVVNSDVPRK